MKTITALIILLPALLKVADGIGKCIVALMQLDQPNRLKKGCAGDTFNTAYHLKSLFDADASVSDLTTMGKDALNTQLRHTLEDAGLETKHI